MYTVRNDCFSCTGILKFRCCVIGAPKLVLCGSFRKIKDLDKRVCRLLLLRRFVTEPADHHAILHAQTAESVKRLALRQEVIAFSAFRHEHLAKLVKISESMNSCRHDIRSLAVLVPGRHHKQLLVPRFLV